MSLLGAIAFFWLLGVEVHSAARRLDHAANVELHKSRSYHAGVAFGLFVKCSGVLVTGLYALDGAVLGRVLFAFLVVRSAIGKGAGLARSFGAGFEAASGRFPRHLAATFGLLVVAVLVVCRWSWS